MKYSICMYACNVCTYAWGMYICSFVHVYDVYATGLALLFDTPSGCAVYHSHTCGLAQSAIPLSCGWDMLRCEESSDGFQSLATLQLKSWFPVGCWNIGGGYLSVQPQPVWHAATQRFTVEDFNRFSLLPSRLGFVSPNKNGRQKFRVNCISGDSWSCCIGLYKSKKWQMAFELFLGEKKYLELSSCNILGQLRVLRSVSCGLGRLRETSSVGREFHVRSSGAQVTTFGLDYPGQHLRRWGIWSLFYMV